MSQENDVVAGPKILFSAPWEPVVVRRGDALGLRALADQFAEAIAPDLSNRIRDGRWVTILAWCLVRSHEAFHASGGRSVLTRTEQRARYAWLRPLELMWVARTIALARDWRNRPLAGQRRVRPWYEDDNLSKDRFGMTPDQFHAYRQIGIYGGYRLAFRKWPEMTAGGDGWTPKAGSIRLAKWLDGKLGKSSRPAWPLQIGDRDEDRISTKSAKLGRGDEYHWWLKKWTNFDQGGISAEKLTIPCKRNDYSILPEVGLLKPLVFGEQPNGNRRMKVACEVLKASASSHIEVCEHLGRAFSGDARIKLLPIFSRLADAGIAAMALIAESLRKQAHVSLADVASSPAAKPICKELFAAAQEWRRHTGIRLRHIDAADRFANAISSGQPQECFRALLHHHEAYGGGLRWFVLRDGRIEPRSPPSVQLADVSLYRFRLWSLCRLATQCGVIRQMPSALLVAGESEDEEDAEYANE